MPSPIIVACRLRPFVKREIGQAAIVNINGNIVSLEDSEQKGTSKQWAFDFAFDSTDKTKSDYASQEVVYDKFGRQLLENALQGFNSTIFAYGQTGTGKTTTIMGDFSPVSEQGILLRLVHELFDEVSKLRGQGYAVACTARMLEVYNEKVKDLLVPHGQAREDLAVRVHPKVGVYVHQLTISAVNSFDECADLISYGNTLKSVAATAMNAKSSRAHTLFILKFEKNDGQDIDTAVSELYFVDLAGRENEKTTKVTGDRLIELSFINKSLFHLSQCIHLLGDENHKTPPHTPPLSARGQPTPRQTSGQTPRHPGATHVPHTRAAIKANRVAAFRNSKLTLLLAEALTGNSRTAMMGTLSPAAANYDENMSTLNFASTVKNIKLEAKAATVNKKDLVTSLQDEIAQLKEQLKSSTEHDLSRQKTSGLLGDQGEESKELADQLSATKELCDQMQKSWDEAKKEAEDQSVKRTAMMMKLGLAKWRVQRSQTASPASLQLPHIANHSDDPHLNASLVYFIPPGKEHSFGSSDSNDIQLGGLGIAPTNCYFKNAGGTLQIRLAKAAEDQVPPQAEVNGDSLDNLAPIALKHHDRVVLGRARAFYVVAESDDGKAPEEPSEVSAPKESSTSASNLAEFISSILGPDADNAQVQTAQEYLKWMRGQHLDSQSETSLLIFLRAAQYAKKLVDEANEITQVVRPKDGLFFELTAVAPMLAPGYKPSDLPALSVRLVREISHGKLLWGKAMKSNMMKQGGVHGIIGRLGSHAPNQQDEMEGRKELSVWSFEKFKGRLDLMRDTYESWGTHPNFSIDPLLDPWKDIGIADAQGVIQKGQTKLSNKAMKLRNARQEVLDLRSKLDEAEQEKKALERRIRELEITGGTGNGTNGGYAGSNITGEGDLMATLARCAEMLQTEVKLVESSSKRAGELESRLSQSLKKVANT